MYNVNFDLMCVVIDVFVMLLVLCWLVLGDMGEVGLQGLVFYEEIGVYVCMYGIDVVLVIGEFVCYMVDVFGVGVQYFVLVEDLIEYGVFVIVLVVMVLVKGLCFMWMECIVEVLVLKDLVVDLLIGFSI